MQAKPAPVRPAPPAYRPPTMQAKPTVSRPAPPVYRPVALQPKPASAPLAPPVYRPATAAAAPGGGRAIQRYTTYWKIKNWGGLGRAMRVSDDGKLAVPESAIFQGSKTLYATADVITAANQRLTLVNAPYVLDQTTDTIQGRVPWTFRTYQTLYRVSPRDSRSAGGLGIQGGSGNNLRTLENCSAHGLDSMGIGIDTTSQALSTREFRIDVGNGQTVRNSGSSMHATDSDLVAKRRIMEVIHRDKHGLLATDAVSTTDARNTYATLTTAERRRYARQFGMNEYAMPQVGEGIEALRAFGNFTGFPMHFAGVVARSGNDYITLENWAKSAPEREHGDTLTASSAWYFRMYGILKTGIIWDDDQSYSGEHAAEGTIADRQHMMGLVNQNVAKV